MKVDLRTGMYTNRVSYLILLFSYLVTFDVPPQEILTRDSVVSIEIILLNIFFFSLDHIC